MPIFDHILRALKEGWIQQLDEHPKPKMVALMGCGRQHYEVARVVPQGFGQLEILGFGDFAAVTNSRQMMGFIEDDKVPGRTFQQSLYALRPFERIDAGDEPVMLDKGIGTPIGHITFTAKDLKI